MIRPLLLVVLMSLLSGCVTSNNQYSQARVRNSAGQRQAHASSQLGKVQDRAGSPVMLGAAY